MNLAFLQWKIKSLKIFFKVYVSVLYMDKKILHTESQKQDTILLSVTSSMLTNFQKFFYC